MTPPGQDWNEAHLSETPAVELLQKLGYTFVPRDTLDAERLSPKQTIVEPRLVKALRKLNPWLSETNAAKVAKSLATIPATSLIEDSEKVLVRLTYGVAIEQDNQPSRTVRFFDFDTPANNDRVVTTQFSVQGVKKNIRPDLVVLVNGIPLAVIECKSPTLGEAWKAEALDQFTRYQELDDKYRELGAPRLFETVQVLIATCGQAAVYGTVTTPHRHYAEWKTTWPYSPKQLEKITGEATPGAQTRTLAGLLSPANLLDLMRNFVVFERDPSTGRIIRKLCRYQQFVAVNKAIERARQAKDPAARGGVVWHTQGSGKSLTMLWLALKLRRDPAHENPLLVIVTDRRDLDEQISKTFVACGFPNPDRADGVRHLKELLSGPTGKTVLTTVQKFQELGGPAASGKRRTDKKTFPVLNAARNIFVLTDEAHRTQYGGLATNMRASLPNAAFLGFTGTPIDKNDRSTLSTFGPYIDTYTIEQAVKDGATVPIFYESRLAELSIAGKSLDALFEQIFADRSLEEREAIKKKYGTEQALAGASKRIQRVALDILQHYTQFIRPNGFKGQVVACSRDVAVSYKRALDELNGPASAVIFSSTNSDAQHLVEHHTTDVERKALVARFLDAQDPLQLLIVCDMLLTGFDAPVEQVMYLDAPLKEHTLLQAIARVNRTAEHKTFGLVVDYWGVSKKLTEALAIFSPSDVKGAMTPKTDELPRLQARHARALRFFDAVKDKDDLDACVEALAPEDVRAQFDEAFKLFAQSLDMLLPDPTALPYVADAKWLGKVRLAARAKYRDGKIDISDCGAKVKKLIDDAVTAEGIEILVKEISLFSPDFEAKLEALRSKEARASEMEHAIRREIHVKLEEDPAFYTSLRQRLEQLIAEGKALRIDAAKQLALLQELKNDIKGHAQAAEEIGLSETGFAIYGLIAGPASVVRDAGAKYVRDDAKAALASVLEEQLESQVTIVDWENKDEVQKEMRRRIKQQLRAAGYAQESLNPTAESIVDLMKRRRGR